jgi:hypothetical protein
VQVILDWRQVFEIPNHPHPNPLPDYREREHEPAVVTTERYDFQTHGGLVLT